MKNYINSNIAWIGDIPSDWKINKIKAMATLSGRIGWQGLTSDEYTDKGAYLITGVDFGNGIINWDSCVHIPMKRWKEATGVQIKENDLLITKDGTVGKVALVKNLPYETSLNSGVLLIRPNDCFDNKFLFYVLQSDVFWIWFNLDNAGNSTITHLYQHNFNNFSFAAPSLNEQIAISKHLDKICLNLDEIRYSYIKQISILEKYKHSLAIEVISGSLSKKEKKHTGNRWFDTVPFDWEVKRLKFLVKHVGSGGTPDSSVEEFYCEDGVKWVAIGDMSTVEYVSDTEKKLTKIGIANKNLEIYPEGTILYSIYASIGKVSELKVPATINQAILAIFVDENQINKSYFKRYLYAVESKVMEDVSTNTQSNLNLFKVLNFDVPLPPMSEQVEISNYLDKKLNEINEIIKQKQKAVDKIYEYKKSLIYEYVTGKKRVEVK